VAHPRGADPDDRLDELAGRGAEERHARLAGDRASEQRLAGAGRPREQDAARDAAAEARVAVGIAQEVDDLVQLALGLLDARDVVEGRALLRGLDPAGSPAAEGPERAAASTGAPRPPGDE